MAPTVETELTKLLGIRYPILLAGMAKVSNADLASAVTRAGGCGVIGGVSKTPEQLEKDIQELKSKLPPNGVFGVDLLLPQVGGSARKTNKDYTRGKLDEIVEILCREKPTLFVSAVGVPPKHVVDKLHSAGIIVANMVGHPKHAKKALDLGADIIIAQGYEAGGHTGEIATSVLVPQVVDVCKDRQNFRGGPVVVVAAGGIYDGRGVAMSLTLGAQGAWIGTRFIVAKESGASSLHQKLVIEHQSSETIRTTIYTGRPVRCIRNEYNTDYETNKKDRIKQLESQGKIVYKTDVQAARDKGEHFDLAGTYPQYAGQCIGGIHSIQPAAEIIEDLMTQACQVLKHNASLCRL